ncbi:MAG TPA: phosphoenolpyruvate carboxykinase domain-containing protein, partial [Vicinamibacteria bacterium]|nr:phosphoenolpyruvate carboxykinase domain-containing protein [Vicinamibacteria bacterium]
DRVQGRGSAVETPIGLVPSPEALRLDGLPLSRADVEALLKVDREEWAAEVPEMHAFFDRFGARLPAELGRALDTLGDQLATATAGRTAG